MAKILEAGKVRTTKKDGDAVIWEIEAEGVQFDFEGVTEEQMQELALSSVKIKAQARAREMSREGAEGYFGEVVSVKDLLVRRAGEQSPESLVKRALEKGMTLEDIIKWAKENAKA